MGQPAAAPQQMQTGKGGPPNANNQWGGNSNYYGGFQGANNVFDQSAAGLGGAMNAAFQGLNYDPYGSGQGAGSGGGGGYRFGGGNAAAGAAGNSLQGWNPTQVQGGSYGSQTLANTDMGQYMNPYTTNVIDQNTADMNRARQMEQMQTGAQAEAGGAFGGSRHALMEAENNRNFYDRQGAMSGNLRNQGFQNAQNAAQFDIGNQNQASQFNIGQDLQGQLANLSTEQARMMGLNQNEQSAADRQTQVNMNNANNANSRWNTQQNVGLQAAQHRLNSANQLANMANLGFGMGNQVNQNMMNTGNQQQMMMQQLMEAAKGQWGGYTGAGGQGLGWNNAALGGTNAPQSSESKKNPGLFDWAGLGAGMFSF